MSDATQFYEDISSQPNLCMPPDRGLQPTFGCICIDGDDRKCPIHGEHKAVEHAEAV